MTRPSYLSRVKAVTGLDRSIAFTVFARCWSALAGIITIFFIARFLTPSEQGFYYTFFSVVSLQVVFELGFFFVIMQMAAHERVRVTISEDGNIYGDAVACARLASILQQSVRWYSVAAILMIVALLPAGIWFFSVSSHVETIAWKGPWALLVVVTALTFQLNPVCGFVEGCGFVSKIASMRLWQALVGTTLVWVAMWAHHGLYAPAMLILGQTAVQLIFLSRPMLRRLLTELLRYPVGSNGVQWRREIWPFQWRIAVTWLSGYFATQLFNPVLFAYQGPVEAGRMGMSLSIASSLGTMGLAWMNTKASPFGTLIAKGETAALDGLFFKTLWQSTTLLSAAAAGLFLCLVTGSHFFPDLVHRVLPSWAFALLLLTTVMNHIFSSEALYLRVHKREPLLMQSVVVAVLLGISTVVLGRALGATAVTAGYFVFGGLLNIGWATYVFSTKRYEWYGSSVNRTAIP